MNLLQRQSEEQTDNQQQSSQTVPTTIYDSYTAPNIMFPRTNTIINARETEITPKNPTTSSCTARFIQSKRYTEASTQTIKTGINNNDSSAKQNPKKGTTDKQTENLDENSEKSVIYEHQETYAKKVYDIIISKDSTEKKIQLFKRLTKTLCNIDLKNMQTTYMKKGRKNSI